MKTCLICDKTKDAEEFYANKKSKDKLNSYCKECDKEAARKRYEIIKADPVLWEKEKKRTAMYVKKK